MKDCLYFGHKYFDWDPFRTTPQSSFFLPNWIIIIIIVISLKQSLLNAYAWSENTKIQYKGSFSMAYRERGSHARVGDPMHELCIPHSMPR